MEVKWALADLAPEHWSVGRMAVSQNRNKKHGASEGQFGGPPRDIPALAVCGSA